MPTSSTPGPRARPADGKDSSGPRPSRRPASRTAPARSQPTRASCPPAARSSPPSPAMGGWPWATLRPPATRCRRRGSSLPSGAGGRRPTRWRPSWAGSETRSSGTRPRSARSTPGTCPNAPATTPWSGGGRDRRSGSAGSKVSLPGRPSGRSVVRWGSTRRSTVTTAKIAYCAIHPGIGVARLGNSPDQFFIGPEAPGLFADPEGGFKDAQGRVKRQAARFRIYGYDAHDRAVTELTSDNADITWTVHLANKKASWFQFGGFAAEQQANQTGEPLPLRNADVEDRSTLVIDPGPRSVSGPSRSDDTLRFDTGTCF